MQPVLVTGATGQQGGVVARALLAAGAPVRALVRDPSSAKATALAAAGAELVRGDLDDPASLLAAASGARAVFSVQMPDLADLFGDSEVRQGRNLATAAAKAGVPQLVHTSVSGAGDAREARSGAYGRWMQHYWTSKAAVEDAVREAGVEHWTLLRPSTFMDNYRPGAFTWVNGRIVQAIDPDVAVPHIAVPDIGLAAAAAIADPSGFHGVELELAAERLTLRQVHAVLTDVLGPTEPPWATPEEARALGLPDLFLESQRYQSEHPAPARPEQAHAHGLHPVGFREWAETEIR